MMHRYLVVLMTSFALGGAASGWENQTKAADFFKPGIQRSLAEAAENGNTGELAKLVAAGADVNAQGTEGMTALYGALSHLSQKGVSWLLDHGANPNVIFTRNGSCATSLAAVLEDPWYLKEVLAHGGDVNVRNPMNERTPLFAALMADRFDNVRMLIAAGADMNTFDHFGATPLFSAAANQRYEIVYDMLVAGADPTITVPKGKGTKTILSVIRRSRVTPDAPAYQWQLKVIELLRQKGLDVEHGD